MYILSELCFSDSLITLSHFFYFVKYFFLFFLNFFYLCDTILCILWIFTLFLNKKDRVMVFSSLIFLYAFLPLVLILYKLPKTIRGKNVVLFIASMFFYAWGEPVWIFQMLISGTSIYVFALLVDKYSSDKKKAFFFLIYPRLFHLQFLSIHLF